MKEKSRIRKILEVTGYVISCLILVVLLAIAVSVLFQTIQFETRSRARIELHSNLLLGSAGIVAFFVLLLIPRFRSNFRWLMKFTHEFTHLFFALLFFRKIYRFKVDSEESYVSYSNGWLGYFTITLSPYCIPLFTLALLPWRFTTDASATYLAIIDVLIGLTYAFHICCWLKQTRLHQTDIIGPGVIRSLLIIATVHLLIFSLILLTPSSGVQNAIERAFWEFPSSFVMSVIH
ncbi:MAG: M50 family metallopeptidase [Bacteroidales bacterium]|nr:M50 family metallopeptidase [Bacteroidales bacterium]